MLPLARSENLLVTEIGAELIVYDLDRHTAHSLNPAASLVWLHLDGETSVSQIARLLHDDVGLPRDERIVLLAIGQLDRLGLLREPLESPLSDGMTRREAVALGLAGAMALLLPGCDSVSAPAPETVLGFDVTPNQSAGCRGGCDAVAVPAGNPTKCECVNRQGTGRCMTSAPSTRPCKCVPSGSPPLCSCSCQNCLPLTPTDPRDPASPFVVVSEGAFADLNAAEAALMPAVLAKAQTACDGFCGAHACEGIKTCKSGKPVVVSRGCTEVRSIPRRIFQCSVAVRNCPCTC